MLIVAIRTFILYGVVLFAVRVMGKSELSRMSPFQMVISFMIAELAAMPIDSSSASLINGIMAIFTLMFLQVFISWLSIKSEKFKNFVSGKPSILIENGKLNIRELERQRITNTDLMEQLRTENCPSISSVRHAILESNGQLTVILKAHERPVTCGDIGLMTRESVLPMIIVSDGTIYHQNLYAAGLNEDIFRKRLADAKINSPEDIFLAIYDEHKKIHVYLSSDNAAPFAVEVKI